MGEPLLTSLSMENSNSHPCTRLSMDPAGSHPASTGSSGGGGATNGVGSGGDREPFVIPLRESARPGAPDINLPLSADPSQPPPSWSLDAFEILDVTLGTHNYESEVVLTLPKSTGNGSATVGVGARKCAKRGDSIWGAWFFFNHYFRPALVEKPKGKVTRDASGCISGFDKSDLRLDVFLVQHDMENMYMWVFKERPDNALGKMQLRSFMNGHSKHGEPSFPFSADKGFARSHRMQRKHYRGLSNPQCLHGIEIVVSPNLSAVPEAELKRWAELTGRELNFSIPSEASDFESWRNLPSTDFELDRPHPPASKSAAHGSHSHKKGLNGSGLNLSTPPSSDDGMDLSPKCAKRRKDFFGHGVEEDCVMANNSCSDREQEVEAHTGEPSWMHEFTGVAKHASGPVTAAKTIYEDDEGYLIVVSMLFSDPHSVRVTWRNTLTHGIVKITCVSTARMPVIKRHDRTFKARITRNALKERFHRYGKRSRCSGITESAVLIESGQRVQDTISESETFHLNNVKHNKRKAVCSDVRFARKIHDEATMILGYPFCNVSTKVFREVETDWDPRHVRGQRQAPFGSKSWSHHQTMSFKYLQERRTWVACK